MAAVAVVIGATCTTTGLFGSWWLSARFDIDMPTGPVMILLAALVFAASSAIRGLPHPVVRVAEERDTDS